MSAPARQQSAQQIVHVRPDTPVEEVIATYERDRVLIIDDLADEATMARLREDLEGPLGAASPSARGDAFLGRNTKRAGALVAHAPACRELVIQPLILALMDAVLGKRSNVQLNATQAMAVQPGEVRQPLHRDRGVWYSLPLPADFECVVNCVWAVDNFTAASGATHLVPGSFDYPNPTTRGGAIDPSLPDGRRLEDLETVQAVMSDGSVVVYSGNVYHGAGANHTDRPRIGMALAYAPAALRQEENQYLCVPPEIARDLPEELQKLLGYELGGYALGFVGNDMQSPMTLLR